jgi:hypothetical protein
MLRDIETKSLCTCKETDGNRRLVLSLNRIDNSRRLLVGSKENQKTSLITSCRYSMLAREIEQRGVKRFGRVPKASQVSQIAHQSQVNKLKRKRSTKDFISSSIWTSNKLLAKKQL